MEKPIITLFIFLIVVFLFGQNDNPYSQFGYESPIMKEQAKTMKDFSLFKIFNTDTTSNIGWLEIDTKRALISLFSRQGEIIASDTLLKSSIARWFTTDPARQYHSPYNGMGNNPIILGDPSGGETITPGYYDDNGYYFWSDVAIDNYQSQGLNFWTNDKNEFNFWSSGNPEFVMLSETTVEARGPNWLVQSMHQGQRNFLLGSIDFSGYMLDRLGFGVSAIGYGLTLIPGLQEIGIPLITAGKGMSLVGGGISATVDFAKGNTADAIQTVVATGVEVATGTKISSIKSLSHMDKVILGTGAQLKINILNRTISAARHHGN